MFFYANSENSRFEFIDFIMALRYSSFDVIETVSSGKSAPISMEEREILEAIEVIFSEARDAKRFTAFRFWAQGEK